TPPATPTSSRVALPTPSASPSTTATSKPTAPLAPPSSSPNSSSGRCITRPSAQLCTPVRSVDRTAAIAEEAPAMTTTQPAVRNGVDTTALFATLDAVKANPDLARFQFRARNTWVSGTHNRSTIDGFFGAGQ